MEPQHVRHERDLDFTIVARVHSHRVEFTLYDVEGWVEGSRAAWHRAGSDTHPDIVETLEEAEPYAHGEVIWDGCSNWHFDEQDRVMLHGCSRHDVQRLGDALARCWDWAGQLLPTWHDRPANITQSDDVDALSISEWANQHRM